jgi:soluble lytic murein transglycosylase-like protein
LIAILAFLIVAIALTTAIIAPDADASTPLRGKLRIAKRELRQARERLQAAEAALAAALAGTTDPAGTMSSQASEAPAATTTPPTVDQLKAKVAKARKAVRVWQKRVRRIARRVREQLQIADWERHAKWMPIIEIAAREYHVKADGMYRIMMRESGGRRFAGADSAFKGLFQYWTGTWAASWNPWRHDSIYDGSSQIFATAYAIHKGMGPQMWTTTFASQY